jgi:hypothetical protein
VDVGTTYAVSWKDSDGSTDAGRLELGPEGLRLQGAGELEIAYTDMIEISIGRGNGDRIGGRVTLLIRRATGSTLRIAPVAQQAALLELRDRLTGLSDNGTSAE